MKNMIKALFFLFAASLLASFVLILRFLSVSLYTGEAQELYARKIIVFKDGSMTAFQKESFVSATGGQIQLLDEDGDFLPPKHLSLINGMAVLLSERQTAELMKDSRVQYHEDDVPVP